MSNLNSENPWGFLEDIEKLDDLELQLELYKECQATFMKMYAESNWEPVQELLASVLDYISCKIQETTIKYNSSTVPF